jgi:transcription initiation factor TFIIF subunit alpha
MKRTASENKRPGSPNLSDASGTDTMRKKQKKKHGSSSQPTARSTPAPGSRQLSPAPSSSAPDNTRPGMPPRQSSIIKLSVESNKLSEISSAAPRPDPKRSRMAAGSGSEGEATGADMSDGNRKKKIKRNAASPPSHSPSGSRAGSPQPNRDGHGSSRAGSPNAQSSKRGKPNVHGE